MVRAVGDGALNVVDEPRMIHHMENVSTPAKQRVRDADGLTARQRQVLEVIRRHIRERDLPPSRSELADELNLPNPSAVAGFLTALERQGWIEIFPSVERGMRLLRKGAPLYEDPVELLALDAPPARRRMVGTKAEPPRLHDFDSFAALFEAKPDFFLRLQDDGMDLAGYQAGDVVAVARGREPQDGDVEVGKVGEDIALRRASSVDDKGLERIGVVIGAIVGTRRGT